MDPNANVAEQDYITDRIHDGRATDADIDRLIDLRGALRNWLSRGGFRPDRMPHECRECRTRHLHW